MRSLQFFRGYTRASKRGIRENERRSREGPIREGREIVSKEEQETAVISLLRGQDVTAILPTWYGKSMILTVFELAIQELSSRRNYVLVISPSKSTIDAEPHSKGIVV